MFKYLVSSFALLSLAACAMGPDYEKPETLLPEKWPEITIKAHKHDVSEILNEQWWKDFKDPVLHAFIEEALLYNDDLLLAAARIAEAQGLLNVKEADYLPQINLDTTANRNRTSKEAALKTPTRMFNDFKLSSVLTFELDLWGRLSRAEESAKAQLLSATFNKEAVQLRLISDVSVAYFNLLSLKAQIEVAEQTLKAREESYRLQQAQYNNGLITQLILKQAESELASTKAQLPQLVQQATEQTNALGVLLGRNPQELTEKPLNSTQKLEAISLPSIYYDAPVTLLENRPDIKSAEQDLIAANANIGLVKASFLPKLSLSGMLGLQSAEVDNLFKANTGTWQVAGALSGPLLTFGRASGSTEAAIAQKDQTVFHYQQVIKNAFKDVLNTLSAQKTASDRHMAEITHVKAREETLRLAQLRYDTGYSNYLEVLDAQRTLFQSQLDLINAKRDQLAAIVDLCKALGGVFPQQVKR
jgi:multidrug efflux system outer membrane protein